MSSVCWRRIEEPHSVLLFIMLTISHLCATTLMAASIRASALGP